MGIDGFPKIESNLNFDLPSASLLTNTDVYGIFKITLSKLYTVVVSLIDASETTKSDGKES